MPTAHASAAPAQTKACELVAAKIAECAIHMADESGRCPDHYVDEATAYVLDSLAAISPAAFTATLHHRSALAALIERTATPA